MHRSARKATRRLGTCPPGPRLQRSRAPECTERPLSRIPLSDIGELLQRSRAPECTESCTLGYYALIRGRSFNGAVHRSARKAGSPLAARPPPRASTEPCTGVHGKQCEGLVERLGLGRFNGAVHRSARKDNVTYSRSIVIAPLQRSRAPECTESSHRQAQRPPRRPRFNGAVHRSARKVTDPDQFPGWVVLLQRSRAPECTERCSSCSRVGSAAGASTEPCTGVHGKG